MFLVPVSILYNNLTRILMGYNKIYELNAFIPYINIGCLLFFVWYLRIMVPGVLIALYVSTFGGVFSAGIILRKEIKRFFFINLDLLRDCFNYGIKTYPLLLINFLNYRADLFLLKYFRSTLEVGYYSLAVGIAELIWLIPDSTISTLFPTIVASDKKINH
jgi:O-antigen/teichoic acid export membrane protein